MDRGIVVYNMNEARHATYFTNLPEDPNYSTIAKNISNPFNLE